MTENKIQSNPMFDEKEDIYIYYEGRMLKARKGQTVAAALIANNIKKLGVSRKLRQARGVYCNNGRCSSCYMTINCEYHVKSCITQVEEGMQIKNSTDDPNVRGI